MTLFAVGMGLGTDVADVFDAETPAIPQFAKVGATTGDGVGVAAANNVGGGAAVEVQVDVAIVVALSAGV